MLAFYCKKLFGKFVLELAFMGLVFIVYLSNALKNLFNICCDIPKIDLKT
jgi:hypothetical protein